MALQDQRQDAVLKKSYRPMVLLLALCGGGVGLGFLVLTSIPGWVRIPSSGSKGVIEVFPDSLSALPSSTTPSTHLHGTPSGTGTTVSERQDSPEFRLSTPVISPGLPPRSSPSDAYDPELIRARIAAVQRGNLFVDRASLPGGGDLPPSADRRAGPAAIAAEGNLVTIHVQQVTAALTLDPVVLQKSTAILSFPADEMYRLEAPINGPGIMVNDQYIPPGGSAIIGTGAVIHLSEATDIHLRPSEPIKAPLGTG